MKASLLFVLLSWWSISGTCINRCFSEIHSAALDFEVINNVSGLPANEIRRIHQDKEGLLWFASNCGLIRFDGYEFKSYRINIDHPKLLFSNTVTALADDAETMWIGTNKGLNYLNKSTQNILLVQSADLQNVTINKIVPAKGNTVWLATSNGLYHCKKEGIKVELKKINFISQAQNPNIKSLLLDSKGRMWIGVDKQGLFRYDFSLNQFIKYPDGKCSNFAHVLYEDHQGRIWVGSWGDGLILLEQDIDPRTTHYKKYRTVPMSANSIGSNIIYSITEDKLSGDIWVGHRQGLSILKGPVSEGNFQNYTFDGKENNLSNNDVSDLFQDHNGCMWLATIGGGINKVDLNRSKMKYDPLPSNITKQYNTRFITAIAADSGQKLWLGLKNKGIVVYDTCHSKYHSSSDLPALRMIPPTANIRSICDIDNGNQMWVGTEDYGLFCIKMNSGSPIQCTHIQTKDSTLISNNNIYQIYQDKLKQVWIGNGNGISVVSPSLTLIARESFQQQGNQRTPVTSFAEHYNGDMWIGTRTKGVIKASIEGGRVNYKCYTAEEDAINNNNVLSVFVDASGHIWAGTQGGGLSLYESKQDKFIPINKKFNIPYDDIFNIFQDSQNHIWACTHNALIRIGVYNESPIEIYDSSEYPWTNVFAPECAIRKISDSCYVIGGMNGLNFLNPFVMSANIHVPPLVITDIRIDYRSIFDYPQQEEYQYTGNHLTLNNDHNNFSAHFAALNYNNPQRNQYAYRLIGFEKEWNYTDAGQRSANYTNLSKGKYKLQIISSNENGVWREKPIELFITVLPSVFDTWYAYLIYTLLLSILLYIIYRVGVNKIHLHNQLRIAEIEKEKQEELTQSKLRFFTNISHELLTPLTIIGCSSESVEVQGENQKKYITTIQNNVNRLITLIRQVLEFSKAENGKLVLKVSEGNLSEIVSSVCENDFKMLARQRGISLTYNIPKPVRGWFDADKVDKIINNLLSNAFKYNYDNSFVHVSLDEDYDEDRRFAIIRVEDGGVGIEPDKIPHIFERFYEDDYRETKKQGTGIGMALTKSLVELHKGDIVVTSIPGKGSCFTVSFPVNEFAYNDEEKMNIASVALPSEEISIQTDSHIKILVVEDNDELRAIICQTLSKSYTVESASNGQEAIDKLNKHSFSLVVTDVMMPVMDGNQLCAFIKSQIAYSHIPVIMLTARTTTEDKIAGYESGADAFITKPFHVSLLISRINNLLKGRELLINNYKKADDSVQPQSITYTSIDEEFITNAIKIVEKNISDEDFSFESLVGEMNVSKSTLYRKIKSLTGMTTSDFVKDIRLKTACRIMRENHVNIAEVAYLVGFGQPKYFTYCFKKKYGILPSEYASQYTKSQMTYEQPTD